MDDPGRSQQKASLVFGSRALRILVVDDNVDAAESLGMLLNLSGYTAEIATDGMTAIEMAEKRLPDVILLDIGMPRLSGHDVARIIRQQPWGKSIVLVALTGWGQERDRRNSAEAGIDHHLVKPVNVDALLALLSRVQPARSRGG
jgi:CheY-like chemotaxis protein